MEEAGVGGVVRDLKDKKIPISGVKKDLVQRVKMHQDCISRQRGGLGEGGMSSNRIVGGESCGEGVGEAGGSKEGGGEGEGEGEGEGRSDVCKMMMSFICSCRNKK